MTSSTPDNPLSAIVIGAGQAGLSAAYHLQRLGIEFRLFDANSDPGGAWQHRWDSLTMQDVHGVADLPDFPAPQFPPETPANIAVPLYFKDFEERFQLPITRGVRVLKVTSAAAGPTPLLKVQTSAGTYQTRALINATGTWDTPFIPFYRGADTFAGAQFHTASYPGPSYFQGKQVMIVGAGASAVQFIGELAPLAAKLVWATRKPPVWRDTEFNPDAGREAVALVEARVQAGLPPASVVSVTGLALRPQEQLAAQLGSYRRRRPMFSHLEPAGARWADGSFEPLDTILWATGFRPSIAHLAPLRLRTAQGGVALAAPRDSHTFTTSVADPRIQFVGYGPSASTIGANRAGRVAALALRDYLQKVPG